MSLNQDTLDTAVERVAYKRRRKLNLEEVKKRVQAVINRGDTNV